MAPAGNGSASARERSPLSLWDFHYTNPLLVSVLSGVGILSARFLYLQLFQRFASVDDVALHRPRWIRGIVTRYVNSLSRYETADLILEFESQRGRRGQL